MPKADAKSGTRVRVWPDTKYFDSPTIPLGELTHLLRSKAVLLPGVKVMLVNEKTGDTKTWQYQDGLRGYLAEALAGAELMVPFSRARSTPAPTTRTSRKARARSGWWPGPRTATPCASPM